MGYRVTDRNSVCHLSIALSAKRTVLPQEVVSGGVTGGHWVLFFPLQFHLPVSKSEENTTYIYLLLRLFWLGACYVCKEFEFLWGIQRLLNREGILLAMSHTKKGDFHLNIRFRKLKGIHTNRQAAIRLCWSRSGGSEWWRHQSDATVLAMSHNRVLSGTLLQNHLLVRFTSWRETVLYVL